MDKEAIQKEIEQLKKGIDDIAYETDFNGIRPLTSVYTERDSANGGQGKADIVFIIDTSGSMGGVIDNVKSNLDQFATGLGDVDAQFGLVQYSDIGYDEPMEKWAFTNDITTFENNLQSLRNDFMYVGGDGPETGLEGMMDSAEGAMSFPFRDNSKKHFVLITDATVHEKGDGSLHMERYLYDVDEVAAELKTQEIQVSVVSDPIGSIEHTQLNKLSTETGGIYLDINSEFGTGLEDLATAIKDGASNEKEVFQPPIQLQVGANETDIFHMDLTDARTVALKIDDLTVVGNAEEAIGRLDKAIKAISSERSKFGAYQNALEYLHQNVTNANEHAISAESRIRDADMALEMAEFTRRNILAQSGQAMLAQSNQLPQGILQLLQ